MKKPLVFAGLGLALPRCTFTEDGANGPCDFSDHWPTHHVFDDSTWRYSQLDLDDGPVRGGRERDWTVGVNWYLNSYPKLQANHVRIRTDRPQFHERPHVFELRAPIPF